MDKYLNTRILELRRQLKIRQGEFAQRLGISQSYLSDVENGKKDNIGSEILYKLKDIYKINLNWLFCGEGTMFTEDLETSNHPNSTILRNNQKIVIEIKIVEDI